MNASQFNWSEIKQSMTEALKTPEHAKFMDKTPAHIGHLPEVEIYCDETGCRGFGEKSSDWFAMTAVMIPWESVTHARTIIKGLRAEINTTRPLHWVEHFRKPNSKQEVRREMVSRMVAAIPRVKVIYVLCHKRTLISSNELKNDNDLFYHYTMRLLLERVAKELKDWQGGPRKGRLFLGSVKNMNHKESLEYLKHNITYNNSWGHPWEQILWPPRWLGTAERDGLQLADLYLGMFRRAIERGEEDPKEARFLLRHGHQIRRSRMGNPLGYGIKLYGDQSFLTSQPWWSDLYKGKSDI